MKDLDLITYCGLYAGTCCGWHENAIDQRLAKALAELVDANNCGSWMPQAVKEFNYREFRKGLEYFGNEGRLTCTHCCRSPIVQCAQYPNCRIKKCCIKRKVDLCFECDDFPCVIIADNKNMLKRAKQYRMLGRKKWLLEEKRKAKQGYEHHTSLYYQLAISKNPK
jgi:hypothetical protein